MPPIFQPEVAAEAIVWASEHDRREIYVGAPTVAGIVGNKFFPALGDWYLARTGFASQQTDEPDDPERRDNLFAPVDADRDFGIHGRFGTRARDSSSYLWMTAHRGAVASALALVAAGAWVARLKA